MRLSGERRDRFLEVLGQTGNRRAAADAIGVDARLMDQRRRYDAPFDRQWKAALEQAGRRLAGAAGPLDCIGGRDLNVIKRGRGGRMQIVARGRKRWSRDVEERFFAALGTCGNVAAAARAVGFTQTCVFRRRRQWVEFAERWEQTLEDAKIWIEFRLATIGHDLDAAALERKDAAGEGDLPLTAGETEAEALRFDPEFALRFLNWREEKRQGRGRVGARKPWMRAEPSIEEVRASIIRKIEAIERAEARGLAFDRRDEGGEEAAG